MRLQKINGLVMGLLVVFNQSALVEGNATSQGLLEAVQVNDASFMHNTGLRIGGWMNAGITYNQRSR